MVKKLIQICKDIERALNAKNKMLHLLPPGNCSKRKLRVIPIYFDVGKCKESESKDEPALKKSKRNLPV